MAGRKRTRRDRAIGRPGKDPIGPVTDGPIEIDPPEIPEGISICVPPPSPNEIFARLSGTVPMALFPVRLEARWMPLGNPTEIVIRIFPDEITIDRHQPGLTETEFSLAQEYWEAAWRTAETEPALTETRSWLSGHLGSHRAAYAARVTRPTNPEDAPKVPIDELKVPPEYPKVAIRSEDGPATAALLPTAFVAYARDENETVGPFAARCAVRSPLPAAPAMVELDEDADVRNFLDAQGLKWIHDLDAAEDAGLVIRIPIDELPSGWNEDSGYRQDIVVVGAASGSTHENELARLFAAHRATVGLEFVNPGDATNRSDGAAVPDVDPLGQRFDSETAVAEPAPKRTISDGFELAQSTNADAAAVALGLQGWTACDRADRADDAPGLDALAMNKFLFPATLGRWMSDPMSWIDSDAAFLPDTAAIRDWYIRNIRPDGPLPTLLVGRQPYGILPVLRVESHDNPVTEREQIHQFLTSLRELTANWDGPMVMDPDDTDTAPVGNQQAADVTTKLAAVWGVTPHARDFRTRGAYLDFEDEPGDYLFLLGVAEFLALAADIERGFDVLVPMFEQRYDLLHGSGGIESQIATMDELIEEVDGTDSGGEVVDYLRETVRPRLTGHESRIGHVRELVEQAGAESRLHPDSHTPEIYYTAYEDDAEDADVLLGVSANAEGAGQLRADLEGLRTLARQPADARNVPPQSETASLLVQLGRNALASMFESTTAVFLTGLDHLIALIDEDPDHAVARIEWLLRAGLGPVMYRTDTWATALAVERLGEMRVEKPNGLHVGAYGWLAFVRSHETPASQGYIHAPSLDYATTAAVLRAGWSAFGTGDAGSELAVDLSAPRMRAANTIVDGVRAGHDIGMVVGSRLEQRLDEGALSHFIDDVRGAVADAVADAPGQPRTSIVDGIIAGRAFTDGIERTPAEDRARSNLDAVVGMAGSQLETALRAAAADLDAVADVLTAQAVHAVLRGDATVASTTLNTIGSGDSGIPPLSMGQTGNGGKLCTHRVIGLLAADKTGDWPASSTAPPAVADPAAEVWAGRLLGSASAWSLVIRYSDGTSKAVKLATLKVCALDVVYHSDDLQSFFGRLVEAGEGDEVEPIEELTVLARRIRHHLGRLRPLTPADVVVSGTAVDGSAAVALAALQARLDSVLAVLADDDPRAVAAQEHEATHADGWSDFGPDRQQRLLRERIGLAAGAMVPVLLPLVGDLPADLLSSFEDRQARTAAIDVSSWLLQVGRVNGGVQSMLDAVAVGELVADSIILEPVVAQLPGTAADPWIALPAPIESEATTTWCCITGPAPRGPLMGFVVDTVTDTIPAPTVGTGLAIHFDRPSAQAPHAVLLGVTPEGESFTLDEVVGIVHDTMDAAWNRAVRADQQQLATQVLPAVYFDDNLSVGTVES